jgi:altronate hydrolase
MKRSVIQIHPQDNVAVALQEIPAGAVVEVGPRRIRAADAIPVGHKIALELIPKGQVVVKYGYPIGRATIDIAPGEWVHTHNLKTDLEEDVDYAYEPFPAETREGLDDGTTFLGYRRADGRTGTRNEIWIVNTVGCVNQSAMKIAQRAHAMFAGHGVDGVYTFTHPFGCSQLGDDLKYTQRVLAGLVRHPNAGGVLILGLGCENNALQLFLEEVGDYDPERIRFFNSQEVADEIEEGLKAVGEIFEVVKEDRRTVRPLSELIVGMKCGGSDAFSGITANPLVGRISDRLVAGGATVILTEVPEMFGAEQILMNRCASESVFADTVRLINDFKSYFRRYDQPIYENPAPGNKEGGITTLEEKSLGCILKGGHSTVTQVLSYGEQATEKGLVLLQAPGNDGVSTTAEVVAGASLVLFTTGRGTPLGTPVPTLKIASNSVLAQRKPNWIDFDAGRLLSEDVSLDDLSAELFDLVLRAASGEYRARNEVNDYREISIFRDGVTM